MSARPFPLAPLLEQMGTVWSLRPLSHGGHDNRPDRAPGALAELVGVTRRTVDRWAHIGLTDEQADHAAIACGFHPAYIWPDEWADSDDELEEVNAP